MMSQEQIAAASRLRDALLQSKIARFELIRAARAVRDAFYSRHHGKPAFLRPQI